jgi:hypothetical protein
MQGELTRLDQLVRCERDTKTAIGAYYDDLDKAGGKTVVFKPSAPQP